MSYILYETDPAQRIAYIILNRPEKVNAAPADAEKQIAEAIDKAERDDAVKAIIIKGAGKNFCGGHDLGDWEKQFGVGAGKRAEDQGKRRPNQRDRVIANRDISDYMRRIFLSLKPTICQIHGWCIEFGQTLQMLCDISIAAEDAKFGHLGNIIGISGSAGLRIMCFLVGPKLMRELLITGRIITGREAADIHLINRAVPPDKLEEEVMKTAKAITLLPLDGIIIGKAYTKMMFESMGLAASFSDRAFGHSFATNLRYEPDEYSLFHKAEEKGLSAAIAEMKARYEGLRH